MHTANFISRSDAAFVIPVFSFVHDFNTIFKVTKSTFYRQVTEYCIFEEMFITLDFKDGRHIQTMS